ncbi:MAG: DUF4357 domain-containing protein [Erysipelotrichia bacterium]|nr:DUF4357 domain-containing protein [Erysipelotrichia bacterium]
MTRKFEVTYYNNKTEGMCSIREKNSYLSSFFTPFSMLEQLKNTVVGNQFGIYYLFSGNKVYLGHTINGFDIIDDINCSDIVWDDIAFFFVAGNKCTVEMFGNLEKLALYNCEQSEKYDLINNSDISEPTAEESTSASKLYADIVFIMKMRGYDLKTSEKKTGQRETYHIIGNGIEASGIYSGYEFVVLAGSQVNMGRKCFAYTVTNRRQNALETGKIIKKDGKYITTVPISFSTPNEAAMFVLGGSVKGWYEWKTHDGKTMGEQLGLYPQE